MDGRLVDALAAEASRIEEDTLFTARGHFEAASSWSRIHFVIGLPTTLLSGLRLSTPLERTTAVTATVSVCGAESDSRSACELAVARHHLETSPSLRDSVCGP